MSERVLVVSRYSELATLRELTKLQLAYDFTGQAKHPGVFFTGTQHDLAKLVAWMTNVLGIDETLLLITNMRTAPALLSQYDYSFPAWQVIQS